QGPNLERPVAMSRDAVSGRTWLTDITTDSVVEIDTLNMNGERTIVADNERPGPLLTFPRALTFDTMRERLIVLDTHSSILGSGGEALLAVDLQSGTRTAVSHDQRGTGVSLDIGNNASGLEYDPQNDQLLVASGLGAAVIAVNAETGDRSVVSNVVTGR